MKNCAVADCRSEVRAMAIVPTSFFRPLLASFCTGGRVFFCTKSVVKPPPWIMKPLITRWKIVPLKWPSFTYCRKFSTVFGALSGYSSSVMVPMLVLISTCGSAANAAVATSKAASATNNLFFIYFQLTKRTEKKGDAARRRTCSILLSGRAFVEDAPGAVCVDPVLALLHPVREITARIILVEGDDSQIIAARVKEDAGALDSDRDPRRGGIDVAFLPRPRGQILRAR